MIGKTVAHYKITAKIGEGGMGEVYPARSGGLDSGLVESRMLDRRTFQESHAMSSEHSPADRRFFARWLRGTFAGYVLGFVLIILGAIAGDLIGMGEAQFIVGIGMGAGVGFAQGRVARQWFGATRHWVWASVIGMGVPFVVFDLVAAFWSEFPDVLSLQLDVAIGGLLVGLWQRRILGSHSGRANWWVPACVVGWTLAAWTASTTFTGEWDAVLNLGMILMGGVVLGVVTGGALVWILRTHAEASTHDQARDRSSRTGLPSSGTGSRSFLFPARPL